MCPRCGGRQVWQVRRNLWRCGGCRHETSVTAGTIFQISHAVPPASVKRPRTAIPRSFAELLLDNSNTCAPAQVFCRIQGDEDADHGEITA